METLVRAVITGFGLALGAAIYHKVARKLGFEEPEEKKGREDDREVTAGGEPDHQG